MASLKSLKVRIGSVKSTQKITKAMKMVAAAKLRRAQQSAESGRPYSARLSETVERLAAKVVVSDNSPRLLRGTGKDDTHLFVVVTSDRGLAGAFNTNILRNVRVKAQELNAQGKTVLFYIVGRKGRPWIQRTAPKAIIGQHDTSQMKAPTYADAKAITEDLVERFHQSQFDVVHLAYSQFKSVLLQEPTIKQIFPVVPATAAEEGKGNAAPSAVEYEPDEEEILADLLPRNLSVQIYTALLENQAGFYGSQMTAMDNATRNAGDMINRLSIQYNRQRQAAITTELVEIISGAEAL